MKNYSKILITTLILLISFIFLSPKLTYAVGCLPGDPNDPCQTDPNGGKVRTDGESAVGKFFPSLSTNAYSSNPTGSLSSFIVTIGNVVLLLGIILFIFYFLYGGLKWLTSEGNPKAIQAAQSTIVQALIGVLLLAIFLILGNIFNQFFTKDNDATETVYICGYGSLNQQLSGGLGDTQCNSDSGYRINPKRRQELNAITPNTICTNPGQCDNGCRLNNNLVPKEYKYCRPPY